jgi:NADH-quinone oxidoreductase subunit N
VGASVATHAYVLATVAMVSAAVAAFFYLRVAVAMYSPVGPAGDVAAGDDPDEGATPTAPAGAVPIPPPGSTVDDDKATATGRAREAAFSDPVSGLTVLTDDPPAESVTERGRVPVPQLTVLAIGLSVAFTVVFGIIPGPILDFAHQATLLFT